MSLLPIATSMSSFESNIKSDMTATKAPKPISDLIVSIHLVINTIHAIPYNINTDTMYTIIKNQFCLLIEIEGS